MIYKNGERMRDFFWAFCFYCSLVFYILGAFLRGEILNYKMVAMDDFKPAYLGIHWCPEFSFWPCFFY